MFVMFCCWVKKDSVVFQEVCLLDPRVMNLLVALEPQVLNPGYGAFHQMAPRNMHTTSEVPCKTVVLLKLGYPLWPHV